MIMDLTKTKISNKIFAIFIFTTLIITSIVAWNNVNFFEKEIMSIERKYLERIDEIEYDDINQFMTKVEEIIFERDVVILYDTSSKKVVNSINVVLDEKYEDEINNLIHVDDTKIIMKRNEHELNDKTYIANIDVKIDRLNVLELNENLILWYLPKERILYNNYKLKVLLDSLTTSSFLLLIPIHFIGRILKKNEI